MNQSDTTVQIAQTVQDLFRHYCAELPDDVVMKVCRNAMINLTHWEEDSTVSVEDNDEVAICLNIIRQLKVLNKPEAINTFSELHRRFKRGNLVANRSSILLFLLRVSEGRYSSLSHNFTKLRIISRKTKNPNKSLALMMAERLKAGSVNKYLFGGETNGDGFEGNRITVKRETSPSIINSTAIPRPSTLSHTNNTTYKRGTSHDSGKDIFSSTAHSPVNTKTFAPKSNMTTIGTINYKCGRVFAPESAVLSDLIYSFQGIPGDIIRLDPDGNFIIDPQVEVKQRTIVEGLLEVGYLHNRVLVMNKVLSKLGSVALGVQAAVTYKMRDYYGFIGELSSKVARQCSGEDTPLRDDGPPDVMITFRALRMLLIPPTAFLQTLCDALLTIGTSHRGGAIISVLHTLSQHGDLRVSDSINFLLSYAGKPLMKMIQSWIVHGELIDPYDEFFVAINQDPKNKNIWHNKFHIRYHLIPNVITESKAEIILKCGKAIHFLNNICNCKVPITGSRLVLHQLKDAAVVSLFDDSSELSRLLVSIYEETSALILESLTNEFKLYQHFLALRKYILLSQGDFATSLIQLLEPEMRKSAKKLQTYKLNGQLSAAIRASSASFEDPDIINRLEVKQLECSDEDTGYDVFSLCYIMNEPIDTAFRISDGAYCHIFNFLWRTKGMNHILMNLVNSRRALKDKISRLSQIIPETKEVLIRADRLSMELVHFAKEFEYYLQFEVIECVWEKFSETFQKAKSLDDVIIAHNHFVATIEKQTFLDPSSRNFITDLRTIWDVVYTLEDLEEKFRSKVLEKLNEKEEEEALRLEEGYEFADLSDSRIKDKEFIKYLHYVKAHYDIFIRNYQNALKKFLLDLSTRKDYQLRMLSARLDYNEYYKRSDSRITDSMKFSRCSDVFTDLIA